MTETAEDDLLSPQGIIGVAQAPFDTAGVIDYESLERLIVDALKAGVDGLIAPGLASEATYLSAKERLAFARAAQTFARGEVPVFWGAGYGTREEIALMASSARSEGAAGLLLPIPPDLYRDPAAIYDRIKLLATTADIPLMIQDWNPGGQGLEISLIEQMLNEIDLFRYLKIETLPAGPKYTAVLEATEGKLHVSGGWAVTQMIEALDRGVHAMIPECSMIRIYKRIYGLHREGKRGEAIELFERLLPVLSFTNQDLSTSIRFFKGLLKAKGIFTTTRDRLPEGDFDAFSEQICVRLIHRVLLLESEIENFS